MLPGRYNPAADIGGINVAVQCVIRSPLDIMLILSMAAGGCVPAEPSFLHQYQPIYLPDKGIE